MNRTVVLSGVIGAVVAIGLIMATVNFVPNLGEPSISTTTQIQTVSASSTTERFGPFGTFSALITDPPTVPIGTSDVYMSYSSLLVHEAGAGNSSQYWYSVGGPGTIDLMQSVNISQTIGLASIPSGIAFDQIGFNVSAVTVTYNQENYSASLPSSNDKVLETIPGGVTVGASQTQAVLIDMSPKVLQLGSNSNQFAFLPSAKAYVVPTSDIPSQAHVLGGRANLSQNKWWRADRKSTRLNSSHSSIS